METNEQLCWILSADGQTAECKPCSTVLQPGEVNQGPAEQGVEVGTIKQVGIGLDEMVKRGEA